MNDTEKKLIALAHAIGAKVTQPIHMSYRIDLPEGMTLEMFVSALNVPAEIRALPELGWDGKPVK
jgi:hypothetical protein